MRIFFDLDGVLAEWNDKLSSEEELYEKGYFLNRPPVEQYIQLAKGLIDLGKDVYVLSCFLSDSPYAMEEKKEWVNMYLPKIPPENRFYIPCGIAKSRAFSSLSREDILIDDYTVNLNDWEKAGGTAVKARNGLNGNNGTWKGRSITYCPKGFDVVDMLTEIGILKGNLS